MTLRTILWICLAASAVLFLLTFLMQVHRLRRGFNAQPGRFRVFINWLLIIIFVGSLGGLIWTRFSTSPANGSVASSSSSSSSSSSAVVHHHNHYSRVSWKPADLVLNENGKLRQRLRFLPERRSRSLVNGRKPFTRFFVPRKTTGGSSRLLNMLRGTKLLLRTSMGTIR